MKYHIDNREENFTQCISNPFKTIETIFEQSKIQLDDIVYTEEIIRELIGIVMRKSKGSVNPTLIRKYIKILEEHKKGK